MHGLKKKKKPKNHHHTTLHKTKAVKIHMTILITLLQEQGLWSPVAHGEIDGRELKADSRRPPWHVLMHEFKMKVSTTNYNQQHLQILQPIKMN